MNLTEKEDWEKYMDDELRALYAKAYKASEDLENYKRLIGISPKA